MLFKHFKSFKNHALRAVFECKNTFCVNAQKETFKTSLRLINKLVNYFALLSKT